VARALSAREIFRRRYPDGAKNFVTPDVLRYGKLAPRVAYELSTGAGWFGGPRVVALTVVAWSPVRQEARSLHRVCGVVGPRWRARVDHLRRAFREGLDVRQATWEALQEGGGQA